MESISRNTFMERDESLSLSAMRNLIGNTMGHLLSDSNCGVGQGVSYK